MIPFTQVRCQRAFGTSDPEQALVRERDTSLSLNDDDRHRIKFDNDFTLQSFRMANDKSVLECATLRAFISITRTHDTKPVLCDHLDERASRSSVLRLILLLCHDHHRHRPFPRGRACASVRASGPALLCAVHFSSLPPDA